MRNHSQSLAALFEATAQRIEALKVDSDAYMIDQVMDTISDDQFAAVIGLHGFVLISDLQIDPATQKIEGVLSHQEKELNVSLVIRGSYARPHDGEWSVIIMPMDVDADESADPMLQEQFCIHEPFDYDPETDAVGVMKAVASLLGSLSGDEADEEAEEEDRLTREASENPSSQMPPSPQTSQPISPSLPGDQSESPDQGLGSEPESAGDSSNPLA